MENKASFSRRLKDGIKVLLGKAVARHLNNSVKNQNCMVCGRNDVEFTPFPINFLLNMRENNFEPSPLYFETLNLHQYECSYCGSSDRERLYALYLTLHKENFNGHSKILDFMPSKPFKEFVKKNIKGTYITADLDSQDVDLNFNIENITVFDSNSIDFFICSHILEHVDDDQRALSELFRITKEGGKGIVMAPIHLKIDSTVENMEINSVADRWKFYGQNDHQRLYNKTDFASRIKNAGFMVKELTGNEFSNELFYTNAIDNRSVLYLVTK